MSHISVFRPSAAQPEGSRERYSPRFTTGYLSGLSHLTRTQVHEYYRYGR